MSDRELIESYLLTVYVPVQGKGTRAYDYIYTYTDNGIVRLVCLSNGEVRYTTQTQLDAWLERFAEYRISEPLEWSAEDENERGIIK